MLGHWVYFLPSIPKIGVETSVTYLHTVTYSQTFRGLHWGPNLSTFGEYCKQGNHMIVITLTCLCLHVLQVKCMFNAYIIVGTFFLATVSDGNMCNI